MATAGSDTDAAGRWLGLAVFLLGIVILVIVFSMAYRDLLASGAFGVLSGSPARNGGAEWWRLAVKGVYLIIMMAVGALIANRGIGLYAASRGTHED
jgi:hypothetical protein